MIKTTGPQDIQDAFRAVGLTFNDAIARGVLAGALVVESDAKALVPTKSGTLKRSITHTEPEVNDGVVEVQVGTNVEYGPYIEYGTGIHAVNGDGRKTPWVYRSPDGSFHITSGSPPQPYLAPALVRNINMVKSLIAQSIKTEFPG